MLLAALISTLLASIVVFLFFTLLLLFLILYAKAKLTATGPVTITINGEKELRVQGGNTLLTTLGNEKIFLPSACGGSGTCSQCRCQVLDGGGGYPAYRRTLFHPEADPGTLASRLPGESETRHENQRSGACFRH